MAKRKANYGWPAGFPGKRLEIEGDESQEDFPSLFARCGSIAKTAAALGTSPRQVCRWKAGGNISPVWQRIIRETLERMKP